MEATKISATKTIFFTACALIAFAANSVLCRLALGDETIDAASFTIIRLLSGAISLLVILRLSSTLGGTNSGTPGNNKASSLKENWIAAFMLFLYAVTFSYAYTTLDTGTGALILFGTVQITIILATIFSGGRLHTAEWIGTLVAFSGFVYLVLPNVSTPSFSGFILMTISGIGWGIYTLKGRGSKNPLADTTKNFYLTIPLVIVLALLTFQNINITTEGILLAIASGAIASGMGYTIWYIALGGLSATQAAVVQLLVPVIAAFGGVIFVSEVISLRLTISATFILGGILIVVLGRYYFIQRKTSARPIENKA
jgi:drug/metabolite transporter (DMT)-like permease